MAAKTATPITPNPTHEEVRAWARTKKEFKDIGERGRIPSAVRQAYNAEHPDRPYMVAARTSATIEGMGDEVIEAAEKVVRSVSIVQALMTYAVDLADPEGDNYHPDVSREMHRLYDEVMNR
jgi:hypothetical protein